MRIHHNEILALTGAAVECDQTGLCNLCTERLMNPSTRMQQLDRSVNTFLCSHYERVMHSGVTSNFGPLHDLNNEPQFPISTVAI